MTTTLTSEGGDARVLAGDWLVRAAGAGEWRTVAERGLDESGWQATSTPGRWWLDPGLADESAVLYRRHFELSADLADELDSAEHDDPHRDTHRNTHRDARWWLVASGLCELGHLWFDGTYLGDLRGRHIEHTFEVGHLLRSRREHLTAVEASHGAVRVPQGHDAQVQIQRTGPARIERVRALVIEASPDRAVLRIAATVDSAGTHRCEITTTVLPLSSAGGDPPAALDDGQDGVPGSGIARSAPVLARGRNELDWLVAIEQPLLWWPAGMGQHDRYRIAIDVSIDGRTSHAVQRPTGIRTLALRRGEVYVNGEGCGFGPRDLTTIRRALAHRGTYAEADAAGRLLCQQITLEPTAFAGAERGLRALAARAAASAADHAGHCPSVAAWQLVQAPGALGRPKLLKPWSRRTVSAAMSSADPTRPNRHSTESSR